MKFGVIQFPGSCDDQDALAAAQRVADAEIIWHRERHLHGADAIIVPGGFSYGDYLRAGAIARFSPAMEAVIEFASDGGLVLGICNGFQVLCESGSQPCHVPFAERHRPASRNAVRRVREADEPLPLLRLEQLHDRREPPSTRLLAERQLLDEIRRSPRCRRLARHGDDAIRANVTGMCRLPGDS